MMTSQNLRQWMIVVLCGVLTPATGKPAQPQSRKDIPFVSGAETAHAQQTLDAYWTPDRSGQPVMIYIHGGGWRNGDKGNVLHKPQAFAEQGFAFVSINYRLHPKVDFRAQAADVAKAIKHVVAKSAEVGVDAERIYLMGHSAGAHLAALVATDARYLQAEGLPLATIKGVVLLDGACYDIPKQIETVGRARSELVYETVFGKDVAIQREASPITHVAADKEIPPFLILPIASRPDSNAQSQSLAEKLKNAGVSAQVIPCPNQTHGSINQQFGTADHLATTETFRFLRERQSRLATPAEPAPN